MVNQLCYYNIGDIESNKEIFIAAMEKDFGINKKDMEEVTGGYKFLFDSETNTHIRVYFSNKDNQVKTEIIGTIAQDTILAYMSFSNKFSNTEEGEE